MKRILTSVSFLILLFTLPVAAADFNLSTIELICRNGSNVIHKQVPFNEKTTFSQGLGSGVWDITVYGKNSQGVPLYLATRNITVQSEQNLGLNIPMKPNVGNVHYTFTDIDPAVKTIVFSATSNALENIYLRMPVASDTLEFDITMVGVMWQYTAMGLDSEGQPVQYLSAPVMVAPYTKIAVFKPMPFVEMETQIAVQNWNINSRPRLVDPNTVQIRGKLRIHPISQDWICVVGDYNDFMRKRLYLDYGDWYSYLDRLYPPTHWNYGKHFQLGLNEIATNYLPLIKQQWDSDHFFQISDLSNNSQDIPIQDRGYWVNGLGLFDIYSPVKNNYLGGCISEPELGHFAYLKLGASLQEGHTYEIRTRWNELLTFTYSSNATVSYAIQTNQIGYMPDAGQKYAYLGMWMADKGAFDVSSYFDHTFYIRDLITNQIVFTGTIKPRYLIADPWDDLWQNKIAITGLGKSIAQMDFSDFNVPGRYYISVPGIGRSLPFRIDSNVVGNAFYIHARGLFHQRCGIEKSAQYTAWPLGTCHTKTYKAKFVPESHRYTARKDQYGIHLSTGEPVSYTQFQMIQDTATTEVIPNLKGGWHDAADFDHSEFHFMVVQDLLAAYLLFPNKFKDNQLNIPESGNGIPDILDEAEWCVKVWQQAQQADGSVGLWIESTSHPPMATIQTSDKDTMPYCLALPTRESTMLYAGYVALLARIYQNLGNQGNELAAKKSIIYRDSAKNAYDWALVPSNTLSFSWNAKSGKSYTYKEAPDDINPTDIFRAAYNLYFLYDNNDAYLTMCKSTETAFFSHVSSMWWNSGGWNAFHSPWSFAEVTIEPTVMSRYYTFYKDEILKNADFMIAQQLKHPYRETNVRTTNNGYYGVLAWGGSNMLKQGASIPIAYALTKDKRYYDAALLLLDWQNGANPMGRTWTTGLGVRYPVHLLHINSKKDGIYDPEPGITIYGITGALSRQNGPDAANGVTKIHSFKIGQDAYFSLLPKSLMPDQPSNYSNLCSILEKTVPIWHRFSNMEDFEVTQNEFAVDVIGYSAAFVACLLPDNWKPSSEDLSVKPKPKSQLGDAYYIQP